MWLFTTFKIQLRSSWHDNDCFLEILHVFIFLKNWYPVKLKRNMLFWYFDPMNLISTYNVSYSFLGIDLYNLSCSSGLLSFERKALRLDIIEPNSSISTIDSAILCYFMLFLVIVTLAEGHKVGRKETLLASFSHSLFRWLGWNLICW